MTNSEIRNAAAADLAREEADRTFVLTDDAAYFYPEYVGQLLARVDYTCTASVMAPIVAIDGKAGPHPTQRFECFHEDVVEYRA